jgi:predicted transcriptional regulator
MVMEGSTEIDPVKYGALWQKVQDMDKKMDKMEQQMEQLLDMVSRSKGALWLGIGLWSTLTGIAGFFFGRH